MLGSADKRRGVFLLSLGVAAGLHGAALAYALAVYEPKTTETQEAVVTVELVDASVLPDEREPSPPTDKLPSAAASGARQVASAEAASAMASAIETRETAPPQAATAPELGEPEQLRGVETASLSPPVDPAPEVQTSEAPPTASAMPAAQPATEAPEPDAATPPQMTPPPQASQAEPPLTLEAPVDETAAVTLPPPLAAIEPPEVTEPEAMPQTVPVVTARPATKRPLPKTVASLEPPKRTVAAEPKPKEKVKKKAELTKTESKSGSVSKPKAKRLAALPTDGTNDASSGTAKGKSKAASTGKTKAKGTSGSTSSGSGGIGSYANSVRARVARNKPLGTSGRGKAVVTVGLSPSGDIRFTRISRSSGNASLDRAAMTAVQRAAPFPQPPSGATSDQLVFNIPISYQ